MRNPRRVHGEGRLSADRHARPGPMRGPVVEQVIGPEIGPCNVYNILGHSVQVTERPKLAPHRWMVAALFPGCRIDLRFPVRYFPRRQSAVQQAIIYAKQAAGVGAEMEPWVGSDWLVWSRDRSFSTCVITVRTR